MKMTKDDLLLKAALSKDGPRIRTGGCVRFGHKPVWVTYGFPPRKIASSQNNVSKK